MWNAGDDTVPQQIAKQLVSMVILYLDTFVALFDANNQLSPDVEEQL
jgi:hypothetical protein